MQGVVSTGVYVSLAGYFILMIAIGLYAYSKQKNDSEGYMLGGRQLSPSVTALSAGASDMSGWLLMGLPGYMYASGIVSFWICFGLTLGALANYLIVAPRLRVYTEVADNSITLPDYFANRFQDNSHLLRVISAIVVIIFFTVYTAASLTAGGKLFQSSLNLSYDLGLWVTAGIVVLYTLIGGFLAVSMTDFVQGCIMFIALLIVPIVAFTDVGSISEGVNIARNLNPDLLNITNGVTVMGIISLMAWGLGYFGQPHIIVRFMAIRSVKDVPTARNIGMGWMILSLVGAMATGFAGIAYIQKHPEVSLNDPETIFLVFSQILFHPLIAGFLLAAILAAIMSTISSQLLVVSSSLTRDIYKLFLNKEASEGQQVLIGRLSVVAVAVLAIFMASNPDSSVLKLVSNAWAGLGASFGPLVIMSLIWKRMNRNGALAGMIVGALTVIVWVYGGIEINGQAAGDFMYAIVPAFVLSLISIIVVSLATNEPSSKIKQQFAAMQKGLKG